MSFVLGFLKFIGLLLLLFTLILLWGMYSYRSAIQKGCDHVLSIAQNSVQVNYLDDWLLEHALGKGCTSIGGMHGDITCSKNGEFFEVHPLPDPTKSGIPTISLRLSISTLAGHYGKEITSENIHEVGFGHGRDQIIILKNGGQLSSFESGSIESGKLKKINETTYAYCADGKY